MSEDTELHERMVLLAKQLLRRTLENGLQWSQTDDEDIFLYSGASTSVRIASGASTSVRIASGHASRQAHDAITLSVLNSRGTVVESLTSDWNVRPSADPWDTSAAQWNAVLDDLYAAARRSALNVDEVLDSLFADLEDETSANVDSTKPEEHASDEPPF